mmetsp:Transcript_29463/g.44670  ORF Transcript_29463/g.44670 Transcript_29463/m.44670 type:complete len:391 (-) Transcript_29463:1301-2473(-)|eukprot:CAMPEP_0170486574 /NCGR_PEP_ID=MMETSP0208-20121228/5543_1 /TAXON_ID=197538 /ORGANISM="Strombidium inclinatum, Strain S3" /LENGTH=390 /DNA_ID=CAMNT_0010760547 /DNA_START=2420 /DNA_END=3592 /DNA_ORIENTATION=-
MESSMARLESLMEATDSNTANEGSELTWSMSEKGTSRCCSIIMTGWTWISSFRLLGEAAPGCLDPSIECAVAVSTEDSSARSMDDSSDMEIRCLPLVSNTKIVAFLPTNEKPNANSEGNSPTKVSGYTMAEEATAAIDALAAIEEVTAASAESDATTAIAIEEVAAATGEVTAATEEVTAAAEEAGAATVETDNTREVTVSKTDDSVTTEVLSSTMGDTTANINEPSSAVVMADSKADSKAASSTSKPRTTVVKAVAVSSLADDSAANSLEPAIMDFASAAVIMGNNKDLAGYYTSLVSINCLVNSGTARSDNTHYNALFSSAVRAQSGKLVEIALNCRMKQVIAYRSPSTHFDFVTVDTQKIKTASQHLPYNQNAFVFYSHICHLLSEA